jgi:cytochrome c
MNSRYIIAACTAVFGLMTMPPILWAAENDQGRAYYFRYCGSCHGVEGKGGRNS